MQNKFNTSIGKRLCKIFNQPPDKVQSVIITAQAKDVAKVVIHRLVTNEEAQEIYNLFEFYNLVKTDEHKSDLVR